MSSEKRPIPPERMEEFMGFMSVSAKGFENLADGAWMAAMTEDVDWFMKHHKISGTAHDGMMQYALQLAKEQEQKK
jgi:hypothetical protein